METIVTLKSKAGHTKYPMTISSAIKHDNIDLHSKLNQIDNQLKNHNHDDLYITRTEFQTLMQRLTALETMQNSVIYNKDE